MTVKKTSVLFVDDEPFVLQGLQRMLRPMREEWDMHFVGSGDEALRLMEERGCEVVISDMRMPGMNGAQLLTELKDRYPGTVRLILSGHGPYPEMCRHRSPVPRETMRSRSAADGNLASERV